MFLALFEVAIFTIILRLALLWSYNFIFAFGRRPAFWVLFCFVLGFGWFAFAGALMKLSISVAWWSATLALLFNMPPPRPANISDVEFRKMAESLAEDMGVAYSPKKHRRSCPICCRSSYRLDWLLRFHCSCLIRKSVGKQRNRPIISDSAKRLLYPPLIRLFKSTHGLILLHAHAQKPQDS